MNIIQFKEATPNELALTLTNSLKEMFKEELQDFKKDFQPSEPKHFISRSEVAKLLGVSTVTIDSWTKKGRLIAYRIGNRIRYNRTEVEQSLTKI